MLYNDMLYNKLYMLYNDALYICMLHNHLLLYNAIDISAIHPPPAGAPSLASPQQRHVLPSPLP